MITPRRLMPLLGIGAVILTFLYLYLTNTRPSLKVIAPIVGLGELVDDEGKVHLTPVQSLDGSSSDYDASQTTPVFMPGTVKPVGSNYTKGLIMARKLQEDISWIDEEGLAVDKIIYVVDDPKAEFQVPKNKGHEGMVYLTFIIDFYDNLPDVSIFMHAHRWAWHNNEILNHDAAQMVKRLSSERVLREGYMNLRCHWMPGCPDYLHPGKMEKNVNKVEETKMAECWSELFPESPVPEVIASACCAQFALSKERIRAIPLKRYITYRDWLMKTDLPDQVSGRVFEYLWHFIFTGQPVFCPNQHVCYCDGYGLCFENEKKFDEWFEVRYRWSQAEKELKKWEDKALILEQHRINGLISEDADIDIPAVGRDEELRDLIQRLGIELEERRDVALKRGMDPQIRALESGREWHEGDGF